MNDVAAAPLAEPHFRAFADSDALHRTLADEIVARLSQAVARKGQASLVVPGGTTPGPLFEILSRHDAPWDDVTILPSDERWIDPRTQGSIEYLIGKQLRTARAAAARFVPFKTAHATARDAEACVGAVVAAVARPFDVVLLGMGTDGHTASLIPGANGLARALDADDAALVRALNPPDIAVQGERMSLTLHALLNACWIALLIRGETKRAAFDWAMAGTDVNAAPVRAILHQRRTPVEVFWSR